MENIDTFSRRKVKKQIFCKRDKKKKRQKLAFIIRKHAHIYERLLCGMQKVFLELNKRKIKQPFKEKKGFKESWLSCYANSKCMCTDSQCYCILEKYKLKPWAAHELPLCWPPQKDSQPWALSRRVERHQEYGPTPGEHIKWHYNFDNQFNGLLKQ